jgi:GH15 family glucan-1,4-alpha-glucosidase
LPRYLPVAEHGLIGNMRSVALVGTNGTIDWYCCPSFDAPSVFASILDADRGGCFELAAAVPARTKQFYFPDTDVLIIRFLTEDAIGEIEDCMPVSDSAESGRHRLIRWVFCVRGSLPFRARVAPRFDYARQPHTVSAMDGGVVFDSADLSLALAARVPLDSDGRDVTAEFKLAEGELAVFAWTGSVRTSNPAVVRRPRRGSSSRPPWRSGGGGCPPRATAADGARWCTARH